MKIDKISVASSPTLANKNYYIVADVGRQRYPLICLSRPKVVDEESFIRIVEAIEAVLPDGFEFELQLKKENSKAPIKVAKK